MVFKLENSEVVIDGRSIFRAFVITHAFIGVYRAMRRAEKRYCERLNDEMKQIKREQKLSKKEEKRRRKGRV